ncbi:DUF1192 domain-containing protein [Chelativorans sp. AA-79]|uniref:DUF1192 domain-containing protein n=1 Tax=Chelativorans sp. AA-79 TaxID=3028735 RepID=UPI0023F813FD|nr:DUF1192 domain-containing protein [Chelativorans sp. AA-79]WEX09908.1 DUF1192 domain-containing protein [Chelativorans sp. AA-79]
MGIMDEDAAAGPPQYIIGQDLSTFSVEELKRTIALLREEIARVEQELSSKDSTKAAAEALFRRG